MNIIKYLSYVIIGLGGYLIFSSLLNTYFNFNILNDSQFIMINNVLLIVFGWLLGLFAPLIVNYVQDKRKAKIVENALFTELCELQYRLVLAVYQVEGKYDQLNHEFFEWVQSILSEYNGVNSVDSLLKTIGLMLKLTDNEIADFKKQIKQQNQPDSGLSLKKLSLPLLESNLIWLSKFDPILRAHFLEINTHLGFMNEIIDDSHYYFGLSFQNNISSENYQRAKANMIDSYKAYALQARVTIKIISKILSKK
jgi:hypothetical protein